MAKYMIGGLKVEYEVRGGMLREHSEKYLYDFDGEADIKCTVSEDFLREKQKEIPHMSLEAHEYMWTGAAFGLEVLRHNGIILHASCVAKDKKAYLFSARSGTGKSTHTHLWLENLSGTLIINDDKPLLIKRNNIWYACGNPFSGKTNENANLSVPLRAVCFLNRGDKNEIRRIKPSEAVTEFIQQTINPNDKNASIEMLEIIDDILRTIPSFSLSCNTDPEAADISYRGIEESIQDED